jgi:hypothetical protein
MREVEGGGRWTQSHDFKIGTTSAQSYAERNKHVSLYHVDTSILRFFDFILGEQTRLATWSVILCEIELRFFDFSIFQRVSRQGLMIIIGSLPDNCPVA